MNRNGQIHCRADNYIYLNQFKGQKVRNYVEIIHIHQKPRLGPKPGQAKPDFWLWARLKISSSPSHLKPGQSQGFQAKPEPAHHYWRPGPLLLYLYPNLSRYFNDGGMSYVISIIQFLKEKCLFKICAVRYTTVCNSRVAHRRLNP